MPHLFNPLATLVLPSQAQQHQQQQPPQMFAHNGGILQQPQAGIFNFALLFLIFPLLILSIKSRTAAYLF